MEETVLKGQDGLRLIRRVSIVLGLVFMSLVFATWVKPETAFALLSLKQQDHQNQLTQTTSPDGTGNPKDNLKQRVEQLEGSSKAEADVFAAQKEEIEYLTHLTEAMMTVAGMFAIFLAAASWTALEGQRKAAQRELVGLSDKFEKDSQNSLAKLDRLRDELQLDFPMLGRIQGNFMSVLVRLRTACQSLVPRDDTYVELGWNERQEILFYENAITTALLLNTKGYEKELSEIYRLLGIFYGSRFNSTLQENRFETNPDTSDFDRARFYFERAVELNQSSYSAYFHAGHFTQYYDDLKIAKISRLYFERAAQIGNLFQRPMVSAALIELEAFNDSGAALSALERARDRPEYDLDKRRPRPAYVSYLEACALCLRAKRESEPGKSLELAMKKLKEAAEDPSTDWKELNETFEYDREKYFSVLALDSAFATDAERLIKKLGLLIN
jgi:tetratricopeptide (TPR) repeat protein